MANVPINSLAEFLLLLSFLFLALSLCILTFRGLTICDVVREFKEIFDIRDIIGNALIDGTLSITLGFFKGIFQIIKISIISLECFLNLLIKFILSYFLALFVATLLYSFIFRNTINISFEFIFFPLLFGVFFKIQGETIIYNLKNVFRCF